ncbi:MAG: glycerol-3-phosphate dehydrogenase/oxidase [Acidobacteria bacterium]|nr:glycerol-3-phosphate dehydrogenase/oxidase [Acidobacteriota bacterium]
MFPPHWRHTSLAMLDDTVDVVLVGGGITGCGVLLDAAQRGLRVLLVERGDIASGTSSRSSKLVHGGLRYLKQMQFRITRLACRERDRMLALDPHLVHPIRFLYPAFRGDRTPGWQVDLGLWMYDRLTARPEKHTQLDLGEVSELVPGLETDGLDRGLAYTDAMADDARLTLAVAATAHAYGAGVLTRCEALEAVRDATGRAVGLVVRDLETGATHRIGARLVVNASGVWTDAVRERLGIEGRRVRPSRGIHLILPSELLPLSMAVSFPAPDDGRPIFLIPHPEGILLGTTDHFHEGDLDDPRPTEDEVGYLLRAAAAAFPDRGVDRSKVRGAFAGLRPILDIHVDDPSEASREEDIWEENGVLTVSGGKLTTWRSTAEEAVDAILERLPEERTRHVARCMTKGTPLAGLAPRDLGSRLQDARGLEPAVAEGMARRLGGLSWSAILLARGRSELRPLRPGLDLCAAEVRAHSRWSAVLHLEDLLLRRVRLGMWEPETAASLLPALRPILRRELGWSFKDWQHERERFLTALEAWTLEGIRN